MKEIKITWSTDDVIVQANLIGVELTEQEADFILDELYEHHDPQIGICWDTISIYIHQFENEREDKKHRELMKYPFEEGDDYWTIDDGEVTWSCWDQVSEELHDLNPKKIYFTTEQEAKSNLLKK